MAHARDDPARRHRDIHDGAGPRRSFERAVSAAGSLVEMYHRVGYTYRLLGSHLGGLAVRAAGATTAPAVWTFWLSMRPGRNGDDPFARKDSSKSTRPAHPRPLCLSSRDRCHKEGATALAHAGAPVPSGNRRDVPRAPLREQSTKTRWAGRDTTKGSDASCWPGRVSAASRWTRRVPGDGLVVAVAIEARREIEGWAMGTETRTRLALGALLVATLLSFELLFESDGHVGPDGAGLRTRDGHHRAYESLGRGPFLTFELSLAGLFWYLTLVFQASESFYGLPTPGAGTGISRLVSGALRVGLDRLRADPGARRLRDHGRHRLLACNDDRRGRNVPLAPADPGRPSVHSAVRHTGGRRVRTKDEVSSSFSSSPRCSRSGPARRRTGFVRGVGGSRRGRTARRTRSPRSVTGGLAFRMGATCVVATLVAPMFLPTVGGEWFGWRGEGGSGPGSGSGGSGEVNLLVDIAPKLLEQSGQQLFRVTRPRTAPTGDWPPSLNSTDDSGTRSRRTGSRERSALVGSSGDGQPARRGRTSCDRRSMSSLSTASSSPPPFSRPSSTDSRRPVQRRDRGPNGGRRRLQRPPTRSPPRS